jgi:hypothetical protein
LFVRTAGGSVTANAGTEDRATISRAAQPQNTRLPYRRKRLVKAGEGRLDVEINVD